MKKWYYISIGQCVSQSEVLHAQTKEEAKEEAWDRCRAGSAIAYADEDQMISRYRGEYVYPDPEVCNYIYKCKGAWVGSGDEWDNNAWCWSDDYETLYNADGSSYGDNLYTMWQDAQDEIDPHMFVSHWEQSPMWDNQSMDIDRVAFCNNVWDVAHMDIRSIRIEADFTQQEFSQKLCIPLPVVRDWENGVEDCADYIRFMAARLLGVLHVDGV